MNDKAPTITNVSFFKVSFHPMESHISPRGFSSLTYRKSGKVSISATDTTILSKPRSLTFVPSGCAYHTEILEAGEMLVLHVWTAEESPPIASAPICVTPPFADSFLSLFERGLRHAQDPENPYACMADAYRLLSEFDRLCRQSAQAPNAKMIACKQHLDAHITDPDLRVSELAALYGSSEVYFRRQFRECYHVSPIEYIKARRIELACQLLQTQLYTVAEVATRAGFDSISYFSSEFHRAMGCSPREYREKEI